MLEGLFQAGFLPALPLGPALSLSTPSSSSTVATGGSVTAVDSGGDEEDKGVKGIPAIGSFSPRSISVQGEEATFTARCDWLGLLGE
ncbi:hypothetical protein V6N13_111657 [Hibiscus sabdariffa]